MTVDEIINHLQQASTAGYGAIEVILKVAGNEAPIISDGLIFEDGTAHFEISGDG